MSIFGSIASAIFGKKLATGVEASMGGGSGPTVVAANSAPGAAPAAASGAPAAAGGAKAALVDVEAVLDTLDESSDQDLDWRVSIVDLMKLLKLDSSLTARKALATELHYTGDMGDSAKMNVWLHKQVMTKLAENGGKVPADLKH